MPAADRRARRPVVLRLALVLVTALVCLDGCSSDPPARAASQAPATPIGRLNTGAMTLARVDFCALVPDEAVRKALDGGLGDQASWRNGDPAVVDTGVRDVVHEYGCSWSRQDYAASAWIFARPVSHAFGEAVLHKTSRRKGCTAAPGPAFGDPHQRQVCELPGGERRVRLSGLFGDTWLSCQVQGSPDDSTAVVSRRTDAWCVQVANVTNTAR